MNHPNEQSEREAFEKKIAEKRKGRLPAKTPQGNYTVPSIQNQWIGWQARAALPASASPYADYTWEDVAMLVQENNALIKPTVSNNASIDNLLNEQHRLFALMMNSLPKDRAPNREELRILSWEMAELPEEANTITQAPQEVK